MAEGKRVPPTRTRTDALIVAGAGAVGLWAVATGGLFGWLGAALLIGVAPDAIRFARARAERPALLRRMPYVIAAAAYVWLMHPLLRGHMPASRDHGIHYFQTNLLFQELIPTGRLAGWSQSFNHGYPFGESYPTLGYLATGAAHWLSFGAVDLRVSYAWAIAGIWALGMVAVGWLARTITKELPWAQRWPSVAGWAGAAAALLFLFDPGASRQGGWNYLMFHGVWPQMFSSVLWTLALVLQWRALQRPTARRIAVAGACLGASVLAHPFGLISAAGSAACWLIVVLLRNDQQRPALRVWALSHVIALGSCGWWLVSFFESAGSMERSPVLWRTLEDLTFGLATGDLFASHWAWLGPLFVIGVVAVAVRRAPMGLLAVTLTFAMLVLASRESISILELDLVLSGFKNLQFPRYTIELKPMFFAIAGVGAVALAAWALDRASRRPPSGRGTWFLIALVLAPAASTVPGGLERLATRPVGALDTLQRSRFVEDEADLRTALIEEANALGDRQLAVAFFRQKMSGGTYPIITITDAGGTLLLDGHVPAVNFRHRFNRHLQGLRALGITHAIYDRELPEREQDLEDALETVGVYGPYTLARLQSPARVDATVRDEAAIVELEPVGPEDLDLVVSESEGPVHVSLLRAHHVRWAATFEGEPLEISIDRTARGFAQMGFDVPGDGVIELRYQRTSLEAFGGWAGLTTWLSILLALFSGANIRWSPRPIPVHRRPVAVGAAVLLIVLAALFVRARQSRKLSQTWSEAAAEINPHWDSDVGFVRDLVADDELRFVVNPERICDGLMGKDVLDGCNDANHRPQPSAGYRKPYLYRCVEFTVTASGSASVEFDPSGHAVAGFLIRRESGNRRTRVELGVNEEPQGFRTPRRDFHLEAGEAGDIARLDVLNRGTQPERFCLAVALVDP